MDHIFSFKILLSIPVSLVNQVEHAVLDFYLCALPNKQINKDIISVYFLFVSRFFSFLYFDFKSAHFFVESFSFFLHFPVVIDIFIQEICNCGNEQNSSWNINRPCFVSKINGVIFLEYSLLWLGKQLEI